jgi:NNP family nitrate/nitrite transporter-like MFS transporter
MPPILYGLKSGHWPSLVAGWLHLTVSFVTWLLVAALSVLIGQDLHLSDTELMVVVAAPLLGGATLRIVAGWSCDWFGTKRTALIVLGCELVAMLWGWFGLTSYEELLLFSFFLGIGGASFAVALPVAAKAYPPAYHGLVLGLVASGNIGTVAALFFAPRWATEVGWHGVFGAMAVPVLVALGLCARLIPDDGPGRRHEHNAHWWHSAGEMIRKPAAFRLCFFYMVTFGGFVGFCSLLPVFFHDQYRMSIVTSGSVAALCALVGSLVRPVGGYAADRIGGLPTLGIVLLVVAGTVALGGTSWGPVTAVLLMVSAVGSMGFGNGVVFQLVAERFPKDIGLASGVVGAAGGIGGFLLPLWVGFLREMTGSFQVGLWLFSAVAMAAWSTVRAGRRVPE